MLVWGRKKGFRPKTNHKSKYTGVIFRGFVQDSFPVMKLMQCDVKLKYGAE